MLDSIRAQMAQAECLKDTYWCLGLRVYCKCRFLRLHALKILTLNPPKPLTLNPSPKRIAEAKDVGDFGNLPLSSSNFNMKGLYRDNGKENGSSYFGLCRDNGKENGSFGFVEILDKKMEATMQGSGLRAF